MRTNREKLKMVGNSFFSITLVAAFTTSPIVNPDPIIRFILLAGFHGVFLRRFRRIVLAPQPTERKRPQEIPDASARPKFERLLAQFEALLLERERPAPHVNSIVRSIMAVMPRAQQTKKTDSHLVTGSFEGFSSGAFEFLRDLAENQTREWFQEHKADYETKLQGPLVCLVADLSRELLQRAIPLHGDPKRSMFRIYRDIRFSSDKRPYKTHISAALTRGGEKMDPGVLYVHVDPKGSFVAAGFYRSEPDVLRAFRTRIAERPDEFRRVLEKLASAGLTLSPDDDALKRAPRGFESVQEPDLVDVIRRQSWIVSRPLPQKVLKGAGLTKELGAFAEASLPLLKFGWAAIGS